MCCPLTDICSWLSTSRWIFAFIAQPGFMTAHYCHDPACLLSPPTCGTVCRSHWGARWPTMGLFLRIPLRRHFTSCLPDAMKCGKTLLRHTAHTGTFQTVYFKRNPKVTGMRGGIQCGGGYNGTWQARRTVVRQWRSVEQKPGSWGEWMAECQAGGWKLTWQEDELVSRWGWGDDDPLSGVLEHREAHASKRMNKYAHMLLKLTEDSE